MKFLTIAKDITLSKKSVLIARASLVVILALSMSGCLLTSPFWNQEFSVHTNPIPIQAWATNKSIAVKFECAKASHGGLYPYDSPTWVTIANVMPSQNPSYDSLGTAIYSVGYSTTLPASCWHQDSNNLWYSSVRATQTSSSGSTIYRVFDKPGLSCLGAAVGSSGSWLNWAGCEFTYSGSSTAVPYVIFRART